MILFKNNRLVFILAITITVGLFIMLALDFAALHDIHNEYLSKNILETLEVKLSKEVPNWTENKGEWDYLGLSFCIKAVAYTALLGMAIYFYRNAKNQT